MKKLNKIVYNKLIAQAEEAKFQGLKKISSGILNAIGSFPIEEKIEYSYKDMENDIYHDMWRVATRLLSYYDVESVDAEKLEEAIIVSASKMIKELEQAMLVDSVIVGPLEPKVPGENK
jgi:hypothetical protein